MNAFTLSELLVVLVVASLVIAMAFTVLNMVRNQVRAIQKNYQLKQELRFFELTFIRDFNTRNAFYDTREELLILSGVNDSIQYQFLDSVLVREKDTLKITIQNKVLFLDGSKVEGQKIDAIEMEISFPFPNQQLFIQQTKDAAFYLNE